MTATNMCSNFGGKWSSSPLNASFLFVTRERRSLGLIWTNMARCSQQECLFACFPSFYCPQWTKNGNMFVISIVT